MAYTKIHAIQATVDQAITYICNPAKTEEGILISSSGCSPETAAYDFKFTLSKTNLSDPNKAYHLIQSFLPNEVSYQEAHQIGVELADRLLEGNYSYIVTTHIDREHVHNHIIFCAANHVNYEKYHDCTKTYYHIRHLSDTLCKEHNLSIIIPNKSKNKKYNEWQANKNHSSWKEKLKTDIDEAIKITSTYEDCIVFLQAKGYEVKGDTFGEDSLKFIAFRPLDRKHFIRGKASSLGTDYTKERIKQRIDKKVQIKNKNPSPFPNRPKSILKEISPKTLIDTTGEKFTQNIGLKHWADLQNLKIAAASYSCTDSIAELENQIASKSVLAKTARKSLVETEQQLKDLKQILKYAEQYKTNHIYHIHYQKSKNKDAYFRQHETELILYDGAKTMLKRFGMDCKTLDTKKLQNDFHLLSLKKESLQKTYRSAEKTVMELNRKLDNLNQYLNHTIKQQATSDKKIEKDQHLL